MVRSVLISCVAILAATAAVLVGPEGRKAEAQEKRRKVEKTDAEWSRVLSREAFLVTRRKATEPAFSGRYANSHQRGTYACVCCGAELFSSQAKFDSGTGWPSFWRPIDVRTIDTAPDYHGAEPRVEVMCNDCGAHLGHVFADGPPPTGLRYCINSASLKFAVATASKTTAKSKKTPRNKKAPAEEAPAAESSSPAEAPPAAEAPPPSDRP